jgi:hypothetical protein
MADSVSGWDNPRTTKGLPWGMGSGQKRGSSSDFPLDLTFSWFPKFLDSLLLEKLCCAGSRWVGGK